MAGTQMVGLTLSAHSFALFRISIRTDKSIFRYISHLLKYLFHISPLDRSGVNFCDPFPNVLKRVSHC
jgi:hypothetical protein